ncbi:MAG: MerC domain-containing protein [Alphaproteobacteria bacterium]|nr:MerC domain-containing protein [Alphaproteobacteria bacterium]
MRWVLLSIRNRFDRAGILLSGLCVVHCVLGLALVSFVGLGGGVLLAPGLHRVGLALAVAVGVLALGAGFTRHGRSAPLLLGGLGLALMAGALLVCHGLLEAVLTVCGVTIVASAHLWNLRVAH